MPSSVVEDEATAAERDPVTADEFHAVTTLLRVRQESDQTSDTLDIIEERLADLERRGG